MENKEIEFFQIDNIDEFWEKFESLVLGEYLVSKASNIMSFQHIKFHNFDSKDMYSKFF